MIRASIRPGETLKQINTKIPDKLEYYNNINQIVYNMTNLEDEEWKRLLDEIMLVANQINNIPFIGMRRLPECCVHWIL